ncbi:MAG: AAA family ATPase [Candidatus Woesearchaeota archaeon]
MNDDFEKTLVKKDIKEVLGQEEVKKQLKSAILMRRHVILVGPPGIGKTTLVKGFANILPDVTTEGENKKVKAPFIRVQGSPDLTAEDLIGDIDPVKALKHGATSQEAFIPGKIFKADKGILFFDEVNRCSEKLQNTLLQVLEEGRVTIGSYDIDFDADFIFIGTMNPEEASTEPLSDVFLDRFDLIYMKPPETLDIEREIIKKHGKKLAEFPDELLTKTIQFIRLLRNSNDLEKHPSVRATLGIYERSQSNAYLNNNKSVDAKDILDAMISVLSHRIRLKPSLKYMKSTNEFLKEEFNEYFKDEISISGQGP